MNTELIKKILLRIEGGNSVFNTLTVKSAVALGAPADKFFNNEELEILRPTLDDLSRQGYLTIEFKSAVNTYLVHMTAQGAALLRRLRG